MIIITTYLGPNSQHLQPRCHARLMSGRNELLRDTWTMAHLTTLDDRGDEYHQRAAQRLVHAIGGESGTHTWIRAPHPTDARSYVWHRADGAPSFNIFRGDLIA